MDVFDSIALVEKLDDSKNNETDEILAGPFKLALTSQGVEELVAKNQRIRKIKFFDTTEQFGLEIPKISSKSLQKLFMAGSASKVEFVVQSFYSQRNGMMNLTKLFTHAALFKQFETKLHEIFLKSDVLQQWNRNFPRLNITKETNTKTPQFLALIAKAQDAIIDLKQVSLASLQQKILANTKTIAEEKKAQTLQTIRYLNAIEQIIWLMVATSKDPDAAHVLNLDVQKLLASYIVKSDLAEYTPLLLAELCVVAGRVQSMGLSAPLSSSLSSHEDIMLSYEISTLKKSQEEKTKVRITIGNSQSGFESIKTRMETSPKEKSLDRYFEQGRNNEMSLMYLGYVQEACKKRDIFFDSFISQIGNSKNTLVNLTMTF